MARTERRICLDHTTRSDDHVGCFQTHVSPTMQTATGYGFAVEATPGWNEVELAMTPGGVWNAGTGQELRQAIETRQIRATLCFNGDEARLLAQLLLDAAALSQQKDAR